MSTDATTARKLHRPAADDGTTRSSRSGATCDSGDIQFNYVPAGDIKFRIIEDRNGNGKWDTGNLVERRQPERAGDLRQRRGRGHLRDEGPTGRSSFRWT